MISHVFATLPILALFSLGFLLKRVSFFSDKTIAEIRKFVLNISLPALLFKAFLSLEVQAKHTIMILVIYLMCLAMVFIGKLVRRIAKIESPYFPILMGGFEMGMFGYALFISLYGIEHLGKIAFLGIGQTLFVFTILISLLMGLRDQGNRSPFDAVKRFLTNPISMSMVAGIIVGQINPPQALSGIVGTLGEFITLLGSITVPLITITIGYGISIGKTGLHLSLTTILVRKSALFLFALGINHFIIDQWLHMDALYRYALMIMALTPPTFLPSMLVRPNDPENAAYINRTISLDCLISIFATMLAAMFYR